MDFITMLTELQENCGVADLKMSIMALSLKNLEHGKEC